MTPSSSTIAAISSWLVQRLRFATEPIIRDVLARELRDHAAGTWGYRWSESTSARQLRHGIKAARRAGFPVVSLGDGFSLARTDAERHKAAERLREMARDLLYEASLLEHVPLRGEARQGDLFAEVG